MHPCIAPLAIFATLSACGLKTYPIDTDYSMDVQATKNTLSVSTANGRSLKLQRQDIYNVGKFAGALDYANGGGMIATYQTDTATASVLMRQTVSGDFAQASVERLTEVVPPVSGQASFTGDYVGTILSDDNPLGANQVRGDLTMDVDFAKQTIAGQITDRTAYLYGQTRLTVLDASKVNLGATEITRDGGFSGQARVPGVEGTGSYAGLLAGEGASEIVGTVDLGGEIGVFAGDRD